MRKRRRVDPSKIDGRPPTKKRINEDKKRKCGRKHKFNTEEEAEKMARLRSMAIEDGTGHMSAYKCPYCPYYHYGHTPVVVMLDKYRNE